MAQLSEAEQATLSILQEATQILLIWAEADLPSGWQFKKPEFVKL